MWTQLSNGVLTVAMDRPDRKNAVTGDEMNLLADAVEEAAANCDVRTVALSGTGDAFCSGADLQNVGPDIDTDSAGATIDAANRLVGAIVACPKPVVALARGAVAGVGVPIALAADLVVCDETTYFLLAFTRIGLMPDGGASALVSASGGRARAMRLALLAERLPAEDAYAAGLVSHVVRSEDYDASVEALLNKLVTGPQAAFRHTKVAINSATLGALEPAFALEREGQSALLGAADFSEGATAFREKRTPNFSDR